MKMLQTQHSGEIQFGDCQYQRWDQTEQTGIPVRVYIHNVLGLKKDSSDQGAAPRSLKSCPLFSGLHYVIYAILPTYLNECKHNCKNNTNM